jgi:hypothetical protein
MPPWVDALAELEAYAKELGWPSVAEDGHAEILRRLIHEHKALRDAANGKSELVDPGEGYGHSEIREEPPRLDWSKGW